MKTFHMKIFQLTAVHPFPQDALISYINANKIQKEDIVTIIKDGANYILSFYA